MFASITETLERIAAGKIVIVVDGPDRENEGDLTVAAQFATPEVLNFMVTHGRGLLCMPCDAARLDQLRIGPMVRINDASCDTPFAVPIDHRSTTTGISVHDRAYTIASVLDPDSRPWDFRRPGHVFPLRAKPDGVLARPGHTEAAVDLSRLAGLPPFGVICEILRDDGAVARTDDLIAFAARHGLAVASVDDLIEHRTEAEQGPRAARA